MFCVAGWLTARSTTRWIRLPIICGYVTQKRFTALPALFWHPATQCLEKRILDGTHRQHQPLARRRPQADAQAWCPPEDCGLVLLDVRVRSAERRAKDGNPIPGATTAALYLANVQVADAGVYSVLVTNRAGSALSAGAVLVVD